METLVDGRVAGVSRPDIRVDGDQHANVTRQHGGGRSDVERNRSVGNVAHITSALLVIDCEVDKNREASTECRQIEVLFLQEFDCSIADQPRDLNHQVKGFLLGLGRQLGVLTGEKFLLVFVRQDLHLDGVLGHDYGRDDIVAVVGVDKGQKCGTEDNVVGVGRLQVLRRVDQLVSGADQFICVARRTSLGGLTNTKLRKKEVCGTLGQTQTVLVDSVTFINSHPGITEQVYFY